MMADDKAQTPLKIQTRREGKTLFLQCHDGDFFQGKVDQNPYLNFGIVEKIIRQNKFEVVSKNKNQIRIQIYTAILELNSQEALLIKKLEEKIEDLTVKNHEYETELLSLRSRVSLLEQQRQKGGSSLNWQVENLDSTANFDIDCIYKLNFSINCSLISTAVNVSTLWFTYNGQNYNTSSSNRKANTTLWVVTKMMRLRLG